MTEDLCRGRGPDPQCDCNACVRYFEREAAWTADSELEHVADRRVAERLASDAAYRNAEDAARQAEREDEIVEQVWRELTEPKVDGRIAEGRRRDAHNARLRNGGR